MLSYLLILIASILGGSQALKTAVCRFHGPLKGGEIRIVGDSTFTLFEGSVPGLSPVGEHGLTIHTNGDIRKNCVNVGDHFDPEGNHNHGGPHDEDRHVGDLGNIAAQSGINVTRVSKRDTVAVLEGPHSILNRSIVIHRDRDDLGRGNNSESKRTGNSGPSIDCCLIEEENPPFDLATAKCYEPIKNQVVDGEKSFSGDSSCITENGISHRLGKIVPTCSNCLNYKCSNGTRTGGARYLYWELVSVSEECCQDCDGLVHPPNQIIGIQRLADSCNTRVTSICKYNQGGASKRGVVSKTFSPEDCCNDENDQLVPLNTTTLEPRSCSLKTCRKGNYWSTYQVFPGECNCCVFEGELIPDGQHIEEKGNWLSCCNGEMVKIETSRCFLPLSPGPCKAAIERWYFHQDSNTCKRFTYGGCDGNANNFNSEYDCEKVCLNSKP